MIDNRYLFRVHQYHCLSKELYFELDIPMELDLLPHLHLQFFVFFKMEKNLTMKNWTMKNLTMTNLTTKMLSSTMLSSEMVWPHDFDSTAATLIQTATLLGDAVQGLFRASV